VHLNEKNYFVRPVKVGMSKKYFLYLECLQKGVELLVLMVVPVVVEVVLHLHVRDAGRNIFYC